MRYDLGYFDDEVGRVEPIENPFGAESVTYGLGINRHPCDRNIRLRVARRTGRFPQLAIREAA